MTPRSKKDDADADEFARAMTDVVRLKPDHRGRVRVHPTIGAPRRAVALTASVSEHREETSASSFLGPGIDRRELRKLKRGDYVPTRRLDLHGETAAKAVATVKRFIDTAGHRHRCVCIVHGRGLHSEGNVAVIKAHVRKFLRHHPAVLAYSDAPATDGGPGAVYVLLRK